MEAKTKRDSRAYQITAEKAHEISTNSNENPFAKEKLEHLYKLFQSPKLSLTPSCSLVHKGNPLVTAFDGVVPNSIHSKIIDSGTTDHRTGCSKKLASYSPHASNKKVKLANGSLSEITGIGTIKLTSSITLHDVLHVPNLYCNLLSISKFTFDHQC